MAQVLHITTYFSQLDAMALLSGVDLKAAFEQAGVPTSTFYRARLGAELRAATAAKVARVIQQRSKGRQRGTTEPTLAAA